ncbi:MAG TPA: PAS domain-containing protein, partial [Thermoanaerobaculia bacterium]|nr:PAS domain-containing protein [Thermoanaerobaculia bacterium]
AEVRRSELEAHILERERGEAERERLLEQLETERARLQALVEHMPAAVALAEAPSGQVVLANSQVEQIFGHPMIPTPNVESYRAWRAFHPDGRPLEIQEYPLARALQGETFRNEELLYERGDGTRSWLRVSAAPIYDASGHLLGGVVLFNDVEREKQAQESLLSYRARLNLAQKAARIGFFEWIIPADENIWSEELEALYGLPPGGFEGSFEGWRRRVHPEDLPKADEDAARSLKTGELASEWRTVWPDGTVRWIEARGQVFFDAEGRPERMLGINLDVTESKQAEEALLASERRLELAMAAARLGSWHLDLGTLRLTCSASCKANFGRPPDSSFSYEDLLEAIVPEDREGMQQAVLRAIEHHKEYRADYRVLWPDGSPHWIHARGRVTYEEDGRPLFMDGVTLDFTERKNLEESLRQRTEELQEADRRKDDFLAVLAHELRNPLAPLFNTLELLSLKEGDPVVVSQAREVMERQVRQMARLVDDLLDVSRIIRGKIVLRREPVDLAEVVATAVDTSRPLIEARRHALTISLPERPVRLEADAARLAQVLANLLNNAAKYTEVGGRIDLTAERKNGVVVLRVRDNGSGISAEMLPHVFDLFAQAESTLDRAQGGLGIGLTLARRLIEMHGGTVEAQSEGVGRGSEFVVYLPALVEPAGASPVATRNLPGPAAAEGSRRVLVVDDNVDSAESLALLLQLYGHDVRLAHDGLTALDEARASAPDVMLLDIGLPKMDGYAVARSLREDPTFQNLTLIAMTGYAQEEDRRRTREAGFDHHLVKPVDLDALRELLGARASL